MNSSGEVSVPGVGARQARSRGSLAAVTVALAISVALNVLLAHKVQKITALQSTQIADRLLKVGTSVPSIVAKRLDGGLEVISYQSANRPTILYIFTPPCSWCARNIDNFKTLVEKEGEQYRVIGVSLSQEGLADYVAKNELKLPVYSGLSAEMLKAYKLGSTPQTIVISAEGTVLKDWVGAYVGDQKSQVEAFFHVSLPGLREPRAAEEK